METEVEERKLTGAERVLLQSIERCRRRILNVEYDSDLTDKSRDDFIRKQMSYICNYQKQFKNVGEVIERHKREEMEMNKRAYISKKNNSSKSFGHRIIEENNENNEKHI